MKLLNKHAAAAYISENYIPVSPRTLDAWLAAGDRGPRSHKIEGRRVWSKDELDKWVASQLSGSVR